MPWRKYTPKQGKHGPIYHIAKGVQVRQDEQRKWRLCVEKAGNRSKRTIGPGRDGLIKAIKAGEKIAAKLTHLAPMMPGEAPPRETTPTFKAFSRKWHKDNAGRWSEATFGRYEEILRLYLHPSVLFDKRLDAIGRRDIKQFLRGIAVRRSPATVEAVHGVISGIFNEAIDEEYVKANPSVGILKAVLPPKNQRDVKMPDPFTLKERDRFLARAVTVASPAEVMVLKVMAFAGLRLGEALAMRNRHFNREERTYFVAEGYKNHRFGRPKVGKNRLVDLPDFLVAELDQFMRGQRKEALRTGRGVGVDLMFPDPEEGYRWPFSQRKIQTLMKRVCKAAALNVRNPHDLRHTYASILLMAHESPGYVQKQLGHSSISITMDIYCHWIPGEGRKNLETALLGPTATVGATCTAIAPNRTKKKSDFSN